MSRPQPVRDAITALIKSTANGVTMAQMRASSGLKEKKLSDAIYQMTALGLIVSMGRWGHSRYFLTKAQMDAARDDVLAGWAELDAIRKAKRRAIQAAGEKRRAARGPRIDRRTNRPREPRPKKPRSARPLKSAPKYKPAMPKRGPAHLPEAKLVIPPTVKIQVIPTPPGRFYVPPDTVGSFGLVGIGRDVRTGQAWGSV